MVHVAWDTPTAADDQSSPLVERVVTALERNPYVAGRTLWLKTEQGHVILRGVVGSYFQKQMAQEAVRGIDGVEQISNELEVASAT